MKWQNMVSRRETKKNSCITSLSVIEICISFIQKPISASHSERYLPTFTWVRHVLSCLFVCFFLAPFSVWICFVHLFLFVCCLPTFFYSNVFCHSPDRIDFLYFLCILKAQHYAWHKGAHNKYLLNDWMNKWMSIFLSGNFYVGMHDKG